VLGVKSLDSVIRQKRNGWKESRMQWQREEWKDNGWIEKNCDWELEYVGDIKKLIHTHIHKIGEKYINSI
jgi:hypothetical protein